MEKIVIVTNRLPVSVKKEKDKLIFNNSSGGVATGLFSLLESQNKKFLWLGYPGISKEDLTQSEITIIKDKLKKDYEAFPVFISSDIYDPFYNGFCNKIVWPLFHYFPYLAHFHKSYWTGYVKGNEEYLAALLKIINKDDTVWIHDYQLMLLPKMLKEHIPNLKVGFFLHIPFPSSEIFKIIPWRKEILEGLLGADLIGFHTYGYYRHFLSTVLSLLGIDNTFGTLFYNGKIIKADVFPMGINYERYNRAHTISSIKKNIRFFKKGLIRRNKIILSVDRLDYTKGIIKRIEALDHFFQKYPNYIGKVTLIFVVSPSRISIDKYKNLKMQVDEAIGKINGKYSTLNWAPIVYFYKNLDFESLAALYNIADIALLTPLRDGMNLVTKEFIASKNKSKGVLIISEMAGVAEELGEAFIVNPYDLDQVADSIYNSLNMSNKEKNERIKIMQSRLKRNSIQRWYNDFMKKLNSISNEQVSLYSKYLSPDIKEEILNNFKKAKKRVIFFDYDGTLVAIQKKPLDAAPDDELKRILFNLSRLPNTDVVLISGRSMNELEKWFAKLSITLVAEHGVWIKEKESSIWENYLNISSDWKKNILPILETYVDRTVGSMIEEKDHSIAWHYRNVDPEFGEIRANELKSNLLNIVANLNLTILEGKKVLEIKSTEISKGKALRKILENEKFDFVVALGDDKTDEEMFSALDENAFSIKVGIHYSKAKYYVNSYIEVRELLKNFCKLKAN